MKTIYSTLFLVLGFILLYLFVGIYLNKKADTIKSIPTPTVQTDTQTWPCTEPYCKG